MHFCLFQLPRGPITDPTNMQLILGSSIKLRPKALAFSNFNRQAAYATRGLLFCLYL